MSRYEQRRQQKLQNPQVALRYTLTDAELQLLHVLEAINLQLHTKLDPYTVVSNRETIIVTTVYGS